MWLKMKTFQNYSIDFSERSFAITVGGLRWFSFPVSSAIDIEEKTDQDLPVIDLNVTEEEDRVKAVWCTSSNLWYEKIYTLTADESGFYYNIRVRGNGRVKQIRYFTDAGRVPEYEAAGYLLPRATHKNRQDCTYNMYEENEIALDYFAPSPYVYPFFVEEEKGWFGLGLVSKPGQYNYDRLLLKRELQLELPLYGRTVVEDEWEAHGIWGGYGADAMDVIAAYSEWHFANGFCERHADYRENPRWWKGPIFCGWGEQQTLSIGSNVDAGEFATQKAYEKMYETLKEKGLKPSFIIIDAKWQESFGNLVVDKEKWPDMRGFVDRLHTDGIRVCLWMRSHNAEGLPGDECVKSLTNPIAADPSNPKFIERTRKNIYTLLSGDEGCYNCDGFKIDFINCIPEGKNIETYEPGLYGVELIKRWISLVRISAKAAKEDALINLSCAHPYFAPESDQIRLHDYHGLYMRSGCSVMKYRRDIANAVFPDVLIDCDCGGRDSHRDFIRYMNYQPTIGIPDLYWLSPNGDILYEEADFDIIRRIWEEYAASL